MLAEQPEIADAGYDRLIVRDFRKIIRRVRLLVFVQTFDQQVDLRGFEAAGFEVEVEIQFREFLKFDGQQFLVPACQRRI